MTRSLSLAPLLSLFTLSALAPQFVFSQSNVAGLADREISRRYARIEDAKSSIARGDNLFRAGDYEGALGSYKASVSTIPNAPFTAEWLEYAELKYADCAVVVAKERAKNGNYAEARQLLGEAISSFPDHKNAKVLLKQLDDPDRWPPALTPQHVENVGKVEKGLLLAHSSVEIGNYDTAIAQFQDVLRTDPYNSAARRGMENAERKRMSYFKTSYDHMRAKMLAQVDEAWEDKVPTNVTPQAVATTNGRSAGAYLTEKMDKIIFPTVQFQNATVDEAIEYLRIKSKDLDIYETDPTRKGVNIILRAGDAPAAASISLELKNVPMSEALRYITDLAQMKYKVESFAVVVVPISDNNTEMFTRTYRVPPDFLTMGPGGGGAAPAAPAVDPFAAAPAAGGGGGLATRASAKDVLTASGITFADGASASFTAATSTLVVRNTQPNLDLVEAFVDELNKQGPKQVVITTKFVEVSQKNTEELGFDWLLGGVQIQGQGLFAGGGSAGSGSAYSPSNYPFGNAAQIPATTLTDPIFGRFEAFPAQQVQSAVGGPIPLGVPNVGNGGGGGNVTSGLRNGNYAINNSSIDNLLTTGTSLGTVNSAPGILSLAGVFTDPQFQMLMRGLSQKKGVDLMSAPSVTTKGGSRATMEVTREFIYPTEFDPPQLPQGGGGGNLLGGGGATQIATPTTPTAFEMRPTGVRLEAEPTVGPDGNTIEMSLSPEVVEFDGFINYGSPIYSPASSTFLPIEFSTTLNFPGAYIPLVSPERLITPNVINQPIFSVRKVTTGVTVWDGQTVALGGLIREDVQDVEDKVPLLGDIPFLGRLFRSESEQHFKRNLMIFVTAYLIDPSGQRLKPIVAPGATPAPTVGGNPLLPPVTGM